MPKIIEAEVLFTPPSAELRFLPEGPYPAGDDSLSWVAIQHGAEASIGSLNLFDLKTKENQNVALPGRPGFAFRTAANEGTFVVGCERHVGLFEVDSGKFTPLTEEIDAGVDNTIINDGVCFSEGIVFGCKDLEFQTPKAGLYFLRSDKQLFKLRDDQTCSNGKIISATGDGSELLDIDTPTKQIRRYRLNAAEGTLGEPEIVLDLNDVDAFPDGMLATPDGGGVIISFYNPNDVAAGETRQYRLPNGELEAIWQTPGSPRNTCPQLMRVDGAVKLIITTAVEHMSDEQRARHANAGCLFIGETDFESLPDTPLATFGERN